MLRNPKVDPLQEKKKILNKNTKTYQTFAVKKYLLYNSETRKIIYIHFPKDEHTTIF